MATIDNLDIKISASAENATKAIKTLSESLGQLGKQLKTSLDISGFQQIGNATKKISDSLKPVQEQAKKVTKTLEQMTKQYKNLGKGFELKGSTEYIQKQIDNLINKLANAKLKKEELEKSGKANVTAYENAVKDVIKYTNQIESLKNQLKSLNNTKATTNINTSGIESSKKSLTEYEKSLAEFKNGIKSFEQVYGSLSNVPKGLLDTPIQNLTKDLGELKTAYPQATDTIKNFENVLQNLQNIAKGLTREIVQPKIDSTKVEEASKTITQKIEEIRQKFKNSGKDFHFEGNSAQIENEIQKINVELDNLYRKKQKKIELGEIDTKQFTIIIRDIENAHNRLKILENLKPEALNRTLKENAEKAQNLHQALKQLQIPPINESNLSKLQNELEKTKQKMAALKTELSNKLSTGKITANVDDSGYVHMREQIALTGKTIDALQQRIRTVSEETKITSSEMAASFENNLKNLQVPKIREDNIDKLKRSLEQAEIKLEQLKVKLQNDITTGKITANVDDSGYRNLNIQIAETERYIEALKARMQEVSQANQKTKFSLNDLQKVFQKFSGIGSTVSNVVKKLYGNIIKLSSANTKLKKSTEKAIPAMKNLSKQVLSSLGIYVSLRTAVKGFKDAIMNAMNMIETVHYFNVSFEQIGKEAASTWKEAGYESAEAYAKSFSERAKELTSKMTGFNVSEEGVLSETGKASLGIDPNLLMNYQATFAQMSNSMGVASETALKLSTALTEIGADLSSTKNIGFKNVYNDMASGLAGMSRTLDKYGVNIRNANMQQKLNELGLKANITKLNQNDKALLRTIILLDRTRYAWGDMADTINRPANQMRLLQSNLANLARTIGNVFLPTIAKILPYINGFVIALQRAVNWVMKILNIDLSKLGSTGGSSNFDMSYLADDAENTADGLDKADENAKKLKRTILGFDQLNVLNGDDDKDKDEMDSAEITAGLEGALDDILNEYQKVWDEAFAGMENTAQQIADNIQAAFSGIFDTFSQAWAEVGQPVVEAFQFMLENVKGVLVDIGKTFHDVFTSDKGVELIKSILELFRSIFTVIGTIAQAFRTAWNDGGGKALVEALFTMFTDINNLLTAIGDSFSRVFSNGTGAEIISNILGIFTDIFTIIGNIAEGIRKAWEEGGLGDSIWQGILNIINTMLETIHNITTATVEWSKKLDFTPLLESIDNLLKALEPLTENIGKGLEWFWTNVLLPIAGWTIEEAVPTFLNMLTAAIKILNEVIEALKPLAQWLWDEFLKPLGEWAGDTIIAAMETITNLLEDFANWISEHQETVQAFTVIVGGLTAGFVALSAGIPAVTTLLGGIATALGAITSPVGLAVTAIAGLTLLISNLWGTSKSFRDTVTKAFEKVKESIIDAFNKAKEAATPLLDAIKNLASSIYDFYENSPLKAMVAYFGNLAATIAGTALSTAIDVISTAFSGFMEILTGAANIIGGVLDVLTALFTLDFDKAGEGFIKLGEGILQAFTGIFDLTLGIGIDIVEGILKGILDGFADMGGWLKEHVVDPFVGWFKKLFGIHSPSTVMAEQGKFLMEGLFEGINSLIEKVSEIFGNIKDTIVGIWETAKDKTSEIWGNISDSVSEVWESLKDWASEKFESVKETVSGAWDAVSSKTTEIWDGVSKKAGEVWGNLKSWASEKFTSVKDSVSTAWDNVKEKTTTTWDNVKEKANGIWDNLKSGASTKFSNIKTSITTAWDNIKSNTTTTWDNVKTKAENIWNTLKTESDSKFDSIKGYVLTAWKSITEDTPKSWEEVETAIGEVIESIIKTFTDLPSKFLDFGKNIVSSLISGIKSAASGITSTIKGLFGGDDDYSYSLYADTSGISSYSAADLGWYAKGGLFNKASVIGVGEAGTEAVLPLTDARAMNMIADSITANTSFSGIDENMLTNAVARGVAMAIMNNQQNLNSQSPINVTVKLENDEAIARAAIRGQQKLDYRYNPTPRYGY